MVNVDKASHKPTSRINPNLFSGFNNKKVSSLLIAFVPLCAFTHFFILVVLGLMYLHKIGHFRDLNCDILGLLPCCVLEMHVWSTFYASGHLFGFW